MERNYIKSHSQDRCLYLLCPTVRSLEKCRIFPLKIEIDYVSLFYGKSSTALVTQTAFICLQPTSQVLLFPLNQIFIWNYISIYIHLKIFLKMRKWYYFDLKLKMKRCCCKAWFTREHSNPAPGSKASSPAGTKKLSQPPFESTQVVDWSV